MMRNLLVAALLSTCSFALYACVADEPSADQSDASTGGDGATDGAGGGDAGDGASNLSCDAGLTACGAPAACVDLGRDGNNCGTCGHSCLGGGCAVGKCQPRAIFNANAPDAATGSVGTLAVDGTSVFWVVPRMLSPGNNQLALDATIFSCPLSGTCPVPKSVWVQHEMDQLLYIPTTPGYLYFTDSQNDVVERMSTSGTDAGAGFGQCSSGGGSPCVLAGAPHSYVMASDGSSIYWGTNYINNSAFGVWRSPLASPAPTKLGPATVASSVIGIAIDPDDASHGYTYTADHEGNIHAFANDQSGVDPETLATAQHVPGGIVVAYHFVFWTDPTAGKIVKQIACNGSGCKKPPTFQPQDFQGSLPGAEAIGADATTLYWSQGGKIQSCPLTGCTGGVPTTLVDQLSPIHVLVVDTNALYFGDEQGAVWALAK